LFFAPLLLERQQALIDALKRENKLLQAQLDQANTDKLAANTEKLALLDVLKSQARLLQAPSDTQADGKQRRRRWWQR